MIRILLSLGEAYSVVDYHLDRFVDPESKRNTLVLSEPDAEMVLRLVSRNTVAERSLRKKITKALARGGE